MKLQIIFGIIVMSQSAYALAQDQKNDLSRQELFNLVYANINATFLGKLGNYGQLCKKKTISCFLEAMTLAHAEPSPNICSSKEFINRRLEKRINQVKYFPSKPSYITWRDSNCKHINSKQLLKELSLLVDIPKSTVSLIKRQKPKQLQLCEISWGVFSKNCVWTRKLFVLIKKRNKNVVPKSFFTISYPWQTMQ